MIPKIAEEIYSSTQVESLAYFQPPDVLRHSRNVAELSAALANLNGCSAESIRKVYLGGMLHDIGKQFIANAILNKPGTLTGFEREQIQDHPWQGYVHLCRFVSDSTILNTVLYHHERWNGTGYPYGLKEDTIPLEARICAVADVWDALISDRCYRSAWSMLEALDLLWAGAGSLFDPEIVFRFMKLIEDGHMVQSFKEIA